MNTNDKRPKLIDSFLFFNEVDLLKVRLEYLGPIVDYFIIVEAILISLVKKKNLYYQMNYLPHYLSLIRFFTIKKKLILIAFIGF